MAEPHDSGTLARQAVDPGARLEQSEADLVGYGLKCLILVVAPFEALLRQRQEFEFGIGKQHQSAVLAVDLLDRQPVDGDRRRWVHPVEDGLQSCAAQLDQVGVDLADIVRILKLQLVDEDFLGVVVPGLVDSDDVETIGVLEDGVRQLLCLRFRLALDLQQAVGELRIGAFEDRRQKIGVEGRNPDQFRLLRPQRCRSRQRKTGQGKTDSPSQTNNRAQCRMLEHGGLRASAPCHTSAAMLSPRGGTHVWESALHRPGAHQRQRLQGRADREALRPSHRPAVSHGLEPGRCAASLIGRDREREFRSQRVEQP